MDKIPEDVKNEISVKTLEYAIENPPKQVSIPAFNDGAYFGYSLGLQSAEKEIERLKNVNKVFDKLFKKMAVINEASKIQAQIEIIQGYYNKIFIEKLEPKTILDMLESDKNFLQEEQNLLDAKQLLTNKT